MDQQIVPIRDPRNPDTYYLFNGDSIGVIIPFPPSSEIIGVGTFSKTKSSYIHKIEFSVKGLHEDVMGDIIHQYNTIRRKCYNAISMHSTVTCPDLTYDILSTLTLRVGGGPIPPFLSDKDGGSRQYNCIVKSVRVLGFTITDNTMDMVLEAEDVKMIL